MTIKNAYTDCQDVKRAKTKTQDSHLIVVLGAKVNDDGTPSGSLSRRIDCALQTAQELSDPCFLVSGGSSRTNVPTEAEVMQSMLVKMGVSEGLILTDHESLDTLQSVEKCASIIKQHGPFKSVNVCSDLYHILRIVTLFEMLGIMTLPGKITSGRKSMGTPKWIFYWIRDLIALIYDIFLLALKDIENKQKNSSS